WDKFFTIQQAQLEDSNELIQKLLKDLKELAEYKESLEKFSNEIAFSSCNQEKEGPPQDSDIRQLIKEECGIEVCEEQKAEYGRHYSRYGYENPNTTPETESDEIIKSGVEELVPILSENEVISEDKRECDVPISKNSPICNDHSEIFFDSKNDDDISSDDDDFEDIEYVEASLLDHEIVSLAEENGVEEEDVVYQEEEEVDLEDVFQIQDIVLREKLLSINRLIANIESLNDNPTPDHVLNCSISFPISESLIILF
nr:hypothetical protein [Tanacetum cinerariifolium]